MITTKHVNLKQMKQTQFIYNNNVLFSLDFIYEPYFVGTLGAMVAHETHGMFMIQSSIDHFTDNKDVQIRKFVIKKV